MVVHCDSLMYARNEITLGRGSSKSSLRTIFVQELPQDPHIISPVALAQARAPYSPYCEDWQTFLALEVNIPVKIAKIESNCLIRQQAALWQKATHLHERATLSLYFYSGRNFVIPIYLDIWQSLGFWRRLLNNQLERSGKIIKHPVLSFL